MQAFRPVPALAWVPLALVWFGVNEEARVFVIALGAFFPVWLSTHVGVNGTPRALIATASTLGLNGVEQLLRVAVPAAAPSIRLGLRIGMANAFTLVVASESIGASTGLGARMFNALEATRGDWMFADLIMLAVVALGVDVVLSRTLALLIHWERG